MSRRVRTLLVGGVLFVVLLILAVTLPVPYVILSPGPTINTLGTIPGQNTNVIVLVGHPSRSTSGHLNLTTVDVSTDQVTVFQAMVGWLAHDQVVVPHDSIYPPGQSQQQVNQQDHQDFVTSQDSAQAAAFCELGFPQGLQVEGFETGSKAKGVLENGDDIISFNGQSADSVDKLTALLDKATPGTDATVVVKRGDKQVSVSVPLVAAPKGSTGARMGVAIESGCLAPFQVNLGLANEIGGPSAGLMFALGIMDKVGPTDLTNGKFIAGTGTIDPTGKVGPIGGIQLKMIAARRAGASVFLAPSGNCSDVRGNIPSGLNVVKVDTLHNAVNDLLAIQRGQAVPHC